MQGVTYIRFRVIPRAVFEISMPGGQWFAEFEGRTIKYDKHIDFYMVTVYSRLCLEFFLGRLADVGSKHIRDGVYSV